MSITEETLKPNIILISASDLENEIKQIDEKLNQVNENNLHEFEKIRSEIDKLHTLTSWLAIAKSQGVWKSKTCRHVINDACSAWSISEPEKLGIPQDSIFVTENGSKKIIVAKFPELCITCPLYEPKKF